MKQFNQTDAENFARWVQETYEDPDHFADFQAMRAECTAFDEDQYDYIRDLLVRHTDENPKFTTWLYLCPENQAERDALMVARADIAEDEEFYSKWEVIGDGIFYFIMTLTVIFGAAMMWQIWISDPYVARRRQERRDRREQKQREIAEAEAVERQKN